MRIQLVNPPTPSCFSRCTRSGCFPPLDLLSLASYVRAKRPSTTIEILDGDILSLEDIVDRLDADIVGISPKVFSYDTGMTIAQTAYASASRVIIGGALASAIPKSILQSCPYIETVCIGDGEECLRAFADGKPLSTIPNIAYRNGQSIVVGESLRTSFDELPSIDYRLADVDLYMANYRIRFPNHEFVRPLPYYSQKGCYWHDVSGGCIFCRYQLPKNTRRSPKRFWRDIACLVDQYGADLIWDVSDTFTAPRQWVHDLLKAKPQDLHCSFYLYGRASDLDEEMVAVLRQLGCFEILIGVESGNDALLRRANKGITRTDIVSAIRSCSEHGIQVFPAFLLGLPGESKSSLSDTVSLAHELTGYGNIKEISSAILLPLPGSQVFSQLSEYLGYQAWLSDFSKLDLWRAQLDFIKYFTDVRIEELRSAKAQIDSLVAPEYRSTFGGAITV